MGNLKDILYQEMLKYAGEGINGTAYLTSNRESNVFVVVGIATFKGEVIVDSGLVVRLEGDHIIIEKDINSDPLHEALIQAGVPRSQIILAYLGESLNAAHIA
jgi:hypothetical protein